MKAGEFVICEVWVSTALNIPIGCEISSQAASSITILIDSLWPENTEWNRRNYETNVRHREMIAEHKNKHHDDIVYNNSPLSPFLKKI